MDYVEISLLCIFGFALALEAYTLITGHRPITGAARTDARLWLIWPWGWGMLASHFWSPWHSPEMSWLITASIGVGVLANDVHHRIDGTKHAKWAPYVTLIVGLASGLLWAGGY